MIFSPDRSKACGKLCLLSLLPSFFFLLFSHVSMFFLNFLFTFFFTFSSYLPFFFSFVPSFWFMYSVHSCWSAVWIILPPYFHQFCEYCIILWELYNYENHAEEYSRWILNYIYNSQPSQQCPRSQFLSSYSVSSWSLVNSETRLSHSSLISLHRSDLRKDD